MVAVGKTNIPSNEARTRARRGFIRLIDQYAAVAGDLSQSSANIVVCCGDAEFISNGDLEYDVAFEYEDGLFIQEVTHEATRQLVWQMSVAGQLIYRGFPVPSMYPGVEWTQTAIAAANINATPTPARKPVIKKPGPWPIP